jgi:hypothetical protein
VSGSENEKILLFVLQRILEGMQAALPGHGFIGFPGFSTRKAALLSQWRYSFTGRSYLKLPAKHLSNVHE